MFEKVSEELNAKFNSLILIINTLKHNVEELNYKLKENEGNTEIGFWLNPELEAIAPHRSHDTDAGWDIHSAVDIEIKPKDRVLVSTGVHLKLPEGWEAQVRPRSGLAAKNGVTVLNTPGTIDASYVGEVKVILLNTSNELFKVNKKDRIAQLVFKTVPKINLGELIEKPTNNERGSAGFGSTGVSANKIVRSEKERMLAAMKELSEKHGLELPPDIAKDINSLKI